MEFYLPSLAVFFLVMILLFTVVPRLSPFIMTSLAAVLLAFGIYQHKNMFADEYRLSTWQQSWKVFAPGIFIGAVIIFILYSIVTVFSGVEVPVPSMPNVAVPPAETATNAVTSTLNNISSGLSNITSNITGAAASAANTVANAVTNAANAAVNAPKNLRRSFFEVI
jgi:predicted PurR-regulated permease PerM